MIYVSFSFFSYTVIYVQEDAVDHSNDFDSSTKWRHQVSFSLVARNEAALHFSWAHESCSATKRLAWNWLIFFLVYYILFPIAYSWGPLVSASGTTSLLRFDWQKNSHQHETRSSIGYKYIYLMPIMLELCVCWWPIWSVY